MLRPVDASIPPEPVVKTTGSVRPAAVSMKPSAAETAPVETKAASAAKPQAAPPARYLRSAGGTYYSSTGEVLVVTPPITEATLQKLIEMRQEILAPPATAEDLQMAAEASQDIAKAQLELARSRYSAAASAEPTSQSVPPSTTDVKA